MQIQKLKVLAEAGAVRKIEAIHHPTATGWTVQVTYATRHGERCEPLERQRGGARVFTTLDAVASGVFAGGCESFQVVNPRSAGAA